MKITRVESAQAALVETPEPEPPRTEPPEPVETPEQTEARRVADNAALEGTRRLVLELQGRLESVTAQANEHRQAAHAEFNGAPANLPGWLAGVETHRAEVARLTTEADSLKRQVRVATQLLDRLEREQADAEAARTQAAGRVLLTAALAQYEAACIALADAVLSVGAASIAANMSGSFAASVRALLLPDLPALGKLLPALAGFRRAREGQAVATADPAFSQRANQLLRAD